MPADFLMQQMELRERLEDAKDAKALDALRSGLQKDKKSLEGEIGTVIDQKKNYKGAADLVRKLQFLHRLDEEIDAAYENLDGG
jgi:molecular chaperone HscB